MYYLQKKHTLLRRPIKQHVHCTAVFITQGGTYVLAKHELTDALTNVEKLMFLETANLVKAIFFLTEKYTFTFIFNTLKTTLCIVNMSYVVYTSLTGS